MKRSWQRAFLASGLLAGSATFVGAAYASDAADSPGTELDRALDMTDTFAFMRPEGAGPYTPSKHLVLMMTLHPGATSATKFETAATFYFYTVRLTDDLWDDTWYTVTCNAANMPTGDQQMICNVAGTFAAARVNAAPSGTPSDPLRVWAGLRSDPAFFDRAKFSESITSKSLKFTSPGTNAFQGQNVLAIVLDIDVDKVFNPANIADLSPLFGVVGHTERN